VFEFLIESSLLRVLPVVSMDEPKER